MSSTENSDDRECRICRDSHSSEPLLSPCQCSGSMKVVHKKCLIDWIVFTQSVNCGVCRTKYTCDLVIRRTPFWSFIRQHRREITTMSATLTFLTFCIVFFTNVLLINPSDQQNQRLVYSCNASRGLGRHSYPFCGSTRLLMPNKEMSRLALTLVFALPVVILWAIYLSELAVKWNRSYEYAIN